MKNHVTNTRDTNSTECVQGQDTSSSNNNLCNTLSNTINNLCNTLSIDAEWYVALWYMQLVSGQICHPGIYTMYAMQDGGQPVMPSTHLLVTKRQHGRGNMHHISHGYA